MTRSGRFLAHVEPSHVWMRVGVVLVLVVVWAWRTLVNQELERLDQEAMLRTQTLKEIRLARVSVVESQAGLPEPGAGETTWWRERIEREVAKAGLAVARHETKLAEFSVGTYELERRELVVVGPYDGLVRLTAWIETSTPRLRLQDFEIVPDGVGQVRATLQILTPVPGGGR